MRSRLRALRVPTRRRDLPSLGNDSGIAGDCSATLYDHESLLSLHYRQHLRRSATRGLPTNRSGLG